MRCGSLRKATSLTPRNPDCRDSVIILRVRVEAELGLGPAEPLPPDVNHCVQTPLARRVGVERGDGTACPIASVAPEGLALSRADGGSNLHADRQQDDIESTMTWPRVRLGCVTAASR